VKLNLTSTAAASPFTSAEDAVLLFLAFMAAAGLAAGLSREATRRLALGVLASLALLTVAVLMRGALPLALGLMLVFWRLDRWHIQFFNEYKANDLEDQDRQARYHEKNPLRFALIDHRRYVRLNKDDRGAEFLIWRRQY
jgi:hypothetical protein